MVERECESVWPSVVEAVVCPGEAVAALAVAPAGGAAMAALAVIDRSRLDHEGRLDYLLAVRRQQAALAAWEFAVLADLAAEPDPHGLCPAGDEIAAVCQVYPGTARGWLDTATTLRAHLPAVLAAVESGRISRGHAQLFVDETAALLADHAAAGAAAAAGIATELLDRAERATLGQLRRAVRRRVAAADPAASSARHRAGWADRRVVVSDVGDGMAELYALLGADTARLIVRVLDALADKDKTHPGPDGTARTPAQRRADALAVLAAAAASDPCLPRRHGQRPAIQVTVSLTTLLGLDDAPADLDGDPIPAEMARRLAADPTGTWRRLIIDRTGRLLEYGRRTYRPPAELRDHVINRDRTCRFPGCNRPARTADLDHHRDWNHHGITAPGNLGALCERHHRLKHAYGWTVTIGPTGETIWTSPTGRRLIRDPETYPGADPPWQPSYGPPPHPPTPPATPPTPSIPAAAAPATNPRTTPDDPPF